MCPHVFTFVQPTLKAQTVDFYRQLIFLEKLFFTFLTFLTCFSMPQYIHMDDHFSCFDVFCCYVSQCNYVQFDLDLIIWGSVEMSYFCIILKQQYGVCSRKHAFLSQENKLHGYEGKKKSISISSLPFCTKHSVFLAGTLK